MLPTFPLLTERWPDWKEHLQKVSVQLWRIFPQAEIVQQALFALMIGGIVALCCWLLAPVQWMEQRIFDLHLYFQEPRQLRQDLILVPIEKHQQEALLSHLKTLPRESIRAMGVDLSLSSQRSHVKDWQALQQSKAWPIILGSTLENATKHTRLHHPSRTLPSGFNHYPIDQDGTLRRQALFLRYTSSQTQKVRVVPSFAWQIYTHLKPSEITWPQESYLAYPSAQQHYPQLSLAELKQLSPQQLKQKILLFSDRTETLHGRTPFQTVAHPLELHAYALAGLLEGKTYRNQPLLNSLLPLILSVLAILMLWQSLRWGMLMGILSIGALTLSYLSINWLAFETWSVRLDLATPLLASFGTASMVLWHFHRTEGHARRALYHTFRRHLPARVVKALLEKPNDALTQNERRIVTVMFTDIQGFSRMGEKLPPDQIIRILNEYLGAMTEIVFANQGTLDKYIGDGIMAVYGNIGSNNPRQDALYAVKTALEMQNKMAELQKKWMNEGIRPIQIRIGINTGEALVGHVGHPERKEVTVIGDTVNTAARIEKLNKQYHTHILISHNTYEYVKDNAEVRALGEERLPGKSSSVKVYEIKGWKAQQPA